MFFKNNEKYAYHPLLPKVKLITIDLSCFLKKGFPRKLMVVRTANALEIVYFGAGITIRRPYLKHSARALHPELFETNKKVTDN